MIATRKAKLKAGIAGFLFEFWGVDVNDLQALSKGVAGVRH